MTEALSSVASVRAVAACAGYFTRVFLKTFREVALVPDHYVRHLSVALDSLQMTLLSLQRCVEDLNPDWQYLPHFYQRLGGCSKQLKRLCNPASLKHQSTAANKAIWKGGQGASVGRSGLSHGSDHASSYASGFCFPIACSGEVQKLRNSLTL